MLLPKQAIIARTNTQHLSSARPSRLGEEQRDEYSFKGIRDKLRDLVKLYSFLKFNINHDSDEPTFNIHNLGALRPFRVASNTAGATVLSY